MSTLTDEILRRRTFAIISHPDAGKTTLTEKLLLFGGAIQLAGEVRAKGERRRVRSDWMAVERERGREGRDPFDLLDEIEQARALDVTPAPWPIGMGRDFLGPYDLFADALLLFERGVHDRVTEPVHCNGPRRP